MSKDLLATGAALLVASFGSALLLSAADPFWAAEHVRLLVVWDWLQQAALAVGAALLGAGLVVSRLAPPAPPRREGASGPSPDWYA